MKDIPFAVLLRSATLNLGPKWVEQVEYYNMCTEDGKGMGYLNVAFSHLMVGITKYTTPVLPALKKLKKMNKMDVVRDYSLQHLEVSEGVKTRLCDIREHFKLTNRHAENHLNDKIFSALLLEVVKDTPGWGDKVKYKKLSVDGENKSRVYLNLGFTAEK